MDAETVSTYKDSVVPVSDYIVEMGLGRFLSTHCRISLLAQKRVHFKRLNAAGDLGAVFLFEWPGYYSPASSRAFDININNYVPEAVREVAICRTTSPKEVAVLLLCPSCDYIPNPEAAPWALPLLEAEWKYNKD